MLIHAAVGQIIIGHQKNAEMQTDRDRWLFSFIVFQAKFCYPMTVLAYSLHQFYGLWVMSIIVANTCTRMKHCFRCYSTVPMLQPQLQVHKETKQLVT